MAFQEDNANWLKSKKLWIVIAAIIFTGGVIVGLYFLLREDGQEDPSLAPLEAPAILNLCKTKNFAPFEGGNAPISEQDRNSLAGVDLGRPLEQQFKDLTEDQKKHCPDLIKQAKVYNFLSGNPASIPSAEMKQYLLEYDTSSRFTDAQKTKMKGLLQAAPLEYQELHSEASANRETKLTEKALEQLSFFLSSDTRLGRLDEIQDASIRNKLRDFIKAYKSIHKILDNTRDASTITDLDRTDIENALKFKRQLLNISEEDETRLKGFLKKPVTLTNEAQKEEYLQKLLANLGAYDSFNETAATKLAENVLGLYDKLSDLKSTKTLDLDKHNDTSPERIIYKAVLKLNSDDSLLDRLSSALASILSPEKITAENITAVKAWFAFLNNAINADEDLKVEAKLMTRIATILRNQFVSSVRKNKAENKGKFEDAVVQKLFDTLSNLKTALGATYVANLGADLTGITTVGAMKDYCFKSEWYAAKVALHNYILATIGKLAKNPKILEPTTGENRMAFKAAGDEMKNLNVADTDTEIKEGSSKGFHMPALAPYPDGSDDAKLSEYITAYFKKYSEGYLKFWYLTLPTMKSDVEQDVREFQAFMNAVKAVFPDLAVEPNWSLSVKEILAHYSEEIMESFIKNMGEALSDSDATVTMKGRLSKIRKLTEMFSKTRNAMDSLKGADDKKTSFNAINSKETAFDFYYKNGSAAQKWTKAFCMAGLAGTESISTQGDFKDRYKEIAPKSVNIRQAQVKYEFSQALRQLLACGVDDKYHDVLKQKIRNFVGVTMALTVAELKDVDFKNAGVDKDTLVNNLLDFVDRKNERYILEHLRESSFKNHAKKAELLAVLDKLVVPDTLTTYLGDAVSVPGSYLSVQIEAYKKEVALAKDVVDLSAKLRAAAAHPDVKKPIENFLASNKAEDFYGEIVVQRGKALASLDVALVDQLNKVADAKVELVSFYTPLGCKNGLLVSLLDGKLSDLALQAHSLISVARLLKVDRAIDACQPLKAAYVSLADKPFTHSTFKTLQKVVVVGHEATAKTAFKAIAEFAFAYKEMAVLSPESSTLASLGSSVASFFTGKMSKKELAEDAIKLYKEASEHAEPLLTKAIAKRNHYGKKLLESLSAAFPEGSDNDALVAKFKGFQTIPHAWALFLLAFTEKDFTGDKVDTANMVKNLHIAAAKYHVAAKVCEDISAAKDSTTFCQGYTDTSIMAGRPLDDLAESFVQEFTKDENVPADFLAMSFLHAVKSADPGRAGMIHVSFFGNVDFQSVDSQFSVVPKFERTVDLVKDKMQKFRDNNNLDTTQLNDIKKDSLLAKQFPLYVIEGRIESANTLEYVNARKRLFTSVVKVSDNTIVDPDTNTVVPNNNIC